MVTVVDDKWKKLAQDLIRERSIWGPENDKTSRWKLGNSPFLCFKIISSHLFFIDHTEGRSRMRKKMVRNVNAGPQYISKSEKLRKQSVDIMLSHSFKDSNEVTDLNSSFNIPAIKEESVGGVSATTTLTATGIAIEVQREVFGSVPPAKSPEPPAETDSDDEAAYGEQERG